MVLVVDDDQDIREALGDLLSDEGYEVATAGNGDEALLWLREGGRPRVILLDWMMPVMNGEAFLSECERDPQLAGFPIVVITAAGQSRLGALGTRPLVPKPIDVERLLAEIRRLGAEAG